MDESLKVELPYCIATASQPSKEAHDMGMTIQAATGLFDRYRGEFVKEMDGLVRLCRENRVRAPFENGNYLHALTYTDLMIQHTTESFRMITGGGGDGFITTLRASFEAMLLRFRKAGKQAKVIVMDDGCDARTLAELITAFPKEFSVRWARSAGKFRHFIVADTNMVRDEEWHEKLGPESDADIIKAKVYFDNPVAAIAFENKFDSIWNQIS